jgi:hypothetical protein
MHNRRALILNGFLLLVCLGAPQAAWAFFDRLIPQWFPAMQNRGLYGDQFGALNALFSGLAFGALCSRSISLRTSCVYSSAS